MKEHNLIRVIQVSLKVVEIKILILERVLQMASPFPQLLFIVSAFPVLGFLLSEYLQVVSQVIKVPLPNVLPYSVTHRAVFLQHDPSWFGSLVEVGKDFKGVLRNKPKLQFIFEVGGETLEVSRRLVFIREENCSIDCIKLIHETIQIVHVLDLLSKSWHIIINHFVKQVRVPIRGDHLPLLKGLRIVRVVSNVFRSEEINIRKLVRIIFFALRYSFNLVYFVESATIQLVEPNL